ncbi:MAG: phosphatase PAP2 family protein [Gammaproteobacteria bacterium]|nr:phosphatase PAP2 family protein [Gammaproteobacteria bacterium]MBU1444253.1 phosphatase PAP2 family protein [Gammaproteobacteria bacterium]MBU2285459.1 phosphatase PAP2 family protein [Gammaproteobacteria bacterium]MBU2410558.1 phosphatase PAP2 family protein [Gammaproteobacteria bacterium]
MPPPSQPTWTADIGQRMRTLLILKLVGVTAFTWIFFIGYFYLLRHPAFPITVMPLTWLDSMVPFQPGALGFYLSLWLYVGVAPGLQKNFAELFVYGLWVGALCLAGLCIFYFWPTQIPPLAPDVTGHAGFALLKGVDAAGNACPSMHVAVAIFTAIRLEAVLREARTPSVFRALNGLWFAAIAWSTLAVKQHVALDAAAGALLGLAFALPSLHWRPGARPKLRLRHDADIIPSTDARKVGVTTDAPQ